MVKKDTVDQTKATLVQAGYPKNGFTYDTFKDNASMPTNSLNCPNFSFIVQNSLTFRFYVSSLFFAVDMLVSLRTKALEAYNEIMRISL